MDLNLILSIALPVVAVIVVVILLFSMIKTANANEALVVSGVGATKNGIRSSSEPADASLYLLFKRPSTLIYVLGRPRLQAMSPRHNPAYLS